MTPEIVVTHRVFPETSELLGTAGVVHAPVGECFSDGELSKALASAHGAMVFMPDRVNPTFLDAAPELCIVAAASKATTTSTSTRARRAVSGSASCRIC